MVAARCVHCDQIVLRDARRVTREEIHGLRDHLIGCPPALRACAPALPVFDREADVLRHFRFEALP